MTPCARFARSLDEHIAGRCAGEFARRLEEHAAQCDRCRAAETAARAVRAGMQSTLRAAEAEGERDMSQFLAVLHGRLNELAAVTERNGASLGHRGLFRSTSVYGGLAVAAAAAVAIVAVLGVPRMREEVATTGAGNRGVRTDASATGTAVRSDLAPLPYSVRSAHREGGDAERVRRTGAPFPRREGGWGVRLPPPRHGGEGRPASAPRNSRPIQPVDDLAHLNLAPSVSLARWTRIPSDAMRALEARLAHAAASGDDFVSVPPPLIAADGRDADRAAAAALAAHKKEKEIVDSRLFRKLTLAFKATALSDLCESLRAQTGIALEAGRSIADEKVTLFCRDTPLRDVMRQLSRPFGYTWLRSGAAGSYRYELVQDLRSQLMEEELRDRDRNAALLALDREMSRFRRFAGLSPDQIRAQLDAEPGGRRPANPEDPLSQIATLGWGPMQLYFRLSPQDLTALRTGKRLTFSGNPRPGELPIPQDLAQGVLQSWETHRAARRNRPGGRGPEGEASPEEPSANVPGAQPVVMLHLDASELGQVSLRGVAGFRVETPGNQRMVMGGGPPLAVGASAVSGKAGSRGSDAALARDPSLKARVSVSPKSSCPASPRPRVPASDGPPSTGPHVTSADVLEALHRATGINIVADYYTRLYPATTGTVRQRALFDAMNQIGEALRMQWQKDGRWIQFRSATFFQDRVKEVPNRLLTRWAKSRRELGALSLAELVDIGQLSDPQLDSEMMAEGARVCYAIEEWDLARNQQLRPHWRFLATLTPGQISEATREKGLPFPSMLLPQQQQFLALALGRGEDADVGMVDFAKSSLRIVYTRPDSWEWHPMSAGQREFVERQVRLRTSPGAPGRPPIRPNRLEPSPVLAATREEALAAARRLDPHAREEDIVPTELAVTLVYTLGDDGGRLAPRVIRATPNSMSAGHASPRGRGPSGPTIE